MKNQKATGIAKSVLATAISLSMAMSGVAVLPAAAIADDTAPIKTLNFNKGIAEFTYNEYKPNGDPNFQIVKSESVMIKKTGDQIEINGDGSVHDQVDANNFVYEGSGSSAHYTKSVISNQPSTSTDSVKGTALTFGDTVTLPELVKGVSANIEGGESSAASAALDKEVAIGSVARAGMTNKSKMYLSNPLAGQTADAYTITYWEYVPEGMTEDASLMVFEGDVSVALYADAETTPAAAWTQVAVVFTADGAQFYVNGQAVEASYMEVAGGDYSLSAITTPEKLAFGGSDNVTVNTVYDSKLDDVTFYAAALDAEQIQAAYEAEAAKLNPSVDVDQPDAYYSMSDASQFTDIGDNSVTIVDETVAGKSVKAANIAANSKVTTKTGFVLNENPFACTDGSLEGITIGYWYKQSLTEKEQNSKDKDIAEGTDKFRPGNYYNLLIADDTKYIYNAKTESQSGEAKTYLYVDSKFNTVFQEGASNTDVAKIANTYTFSLSAEDADAALKTCTEWRYITVVADNSGIRMYVNGEKYENQDTNVYGSRFSDGYYSVEKERQQAIKLNGVFGGTNNQQATQLLTFIGYEDTRLYFGWQPVTESTNAKESGGTVYSISCYRAAMSDEEVAALYAKETGQSTGSTEEPPVTENPPAVVYGDLDGNGTVEASDALTVLQAVVKLTTLTDAQTKAADVDNSNSVEASDALLILQKVVKLIDKFPVEK